MTTLHLKADTNADWFQPFQAVDANGDALGLTSAAMQMGLRDEAGAQALALSLGNGLTITDAAAGAFELEVDASAMAGLAPKVYHFDLLIEIDGLRLTAARGTVNVRAGVTQWSA
jgi:hypothetical protein